MNSERWARVEELFQLAANLSPDQRAAFLDRACGEDKDLRLEVESLIAHDAPNDDVLGAAVGRAVEQLPDDSSLRCGLVRGARPEGARVVDTPWLPAVVGRYRILRLLGEGGMGAVYEAEQDSPRRFVALKVIKQGRVSPALVRRFEMESQALGRLQHPGIAQIYEAGTADTGVGQQPYIAMEFIRGKSLLTYAEAQHLNTRQRLELMAKICEAVHHAHQRGLIHRDLKPNNILIDDAGQPKILDFGVALVTDSDAKRTRETDVGQLLGTLAYMSPEQVLADPLALDTRSDVYALGVILYELLAGRLPYTLSRTPHLAVQTIREEEALALSPIRSDCRGDIEIIVAKALEKDRDRRYASSAGFAADIRRYLNDEPIAARPPSVSYQLQKFARRHRGLVGGLAAVFMVLIGGIVATTRQAIRAMQAGQAASLERDRATTAEQVATRERDRAQSAERVATMARNRAVAAEAQARKERSAALLEKGRADTQSAVSKAVNEFLQNDLLAMAGADSQARPDRKPDPDLRVRTVLDRAAERIVGSFNEQPLVEAAIRQTIGKAYKELGLYAEAQRHLERAIDLRKRVLSDEDPSVLSALYDIAQNLYRHQRKYEQAEPLFAKILEVRRRVLGEEHPSTLDTMNRLADLYRFQRKYEQAELLFIKALDGCRRVLGEEHPQTFDTMNNLALLYQAQRKFAQAEELFVKASQGCERLLGDEHPETLIVTNNLAVMYRSLNKFTNAEPLFVKVLETRKRVLGEEHQETQETMEGLALLYFRQRKFEQAEQLYARILPVRRRVLGEDDPRTFTATVNLATLYRNQGKHEQAEPLFAKVLDERQRTLGEEHALTLHTMMDLARLYRDQQKYVQAESITTKVLEIRYRVVGEQHPDVLTSRNVLADIYLFQGKYPQAETLLRKALGDLEITTPDTWNRYHSQALLGASLVGQKKFAEAEPLVVSGYEGMRQREAAIPVESRPTLENAGNWVVQLYEDWEKPAQAATWKQKLQERRLAGSPLR